MRHVRGILLAAAVGPLHHLIFHITKSLTTSLHFQHSFPTFAMRKAHRFVNDDCLAEDHRLSNRLREFLSLAPVMVPHQRLELRFIG